MSKQLTEDEIETFASRPREIGARYCGDCVGLLADASGHVLNEHVQGCKGDDWPVVSQWFLFTSGATPLLPDDVARLIKKLRQWIDDSALAVDYDEGVAMIEQLIAAVESLGGERAMCANGRRPRQSREGRAVVIIDLQDEYERGLDESQLAAQVMRLMRLSATCEGPTRDTAGTIGPYQDCEGCGARDFIPQDYYTHPRVPKPLREVRDELLMWLLRQNCKFTLGYFPDGHGVLLTAIAENNQTAEAVYVQFAEIKDEALALALAATRLLGKNK